MFHQHNLWTPHIWGNGFFCYSMKATESFDPEWAHLVHLNWELSWAQYPFYRLPPCWHSCCDLSVSYIWACQECHFASLCPDPLWVDFLEYSGSLIMFALLIAHFTYASSHTYSELATAWTTIGLPVLWILIEYYFIVDYNFWQSCTFCCVLPTAAWTSRSYWGAGDYTCQYGMHLSIIRNLIYKGS